MTTSYFTITLHSFYWKIGQNVWLYYYYQQNMTLH